MKKTVGVVGCGGFVGGACYYTFNQSSRYDVRGYDIEPTKTKNTEEETLSADIVFIAVPTPMNQKGECHLGIVESVIEKVRKYREHSIVIIKSTVLPGTTDRLNSKYGFVFFSPEFLTERRYIQDFIELPYQILGIPQTEIPKYTNTSSTKILKWSNDIVDFFWHMSDEEVIKSQKVISMKATEAEMVKYFRNNYLATRISFCNEMNDICKKLGISYENVSEKAGIDKRVGSHYNRIDPNEPEFSGVCLPKDINATINLAKNLELNPVLLEAVWEKNLQVAKVRSWEKELGRAIVKES